VESGALEEVAALARRNLDPALPVMRALGVPQLLDYIDGRADLETAIENAKRDTRAYAKRQFTFARNQLTAFQWVSPDDNGADVIFGKIN
jgi:tRNA dimethylallyltransferase